MRSMPIAGNESRPNASHAFFVEAYPLARRAAEVRSVAAVARAAVPPADYADLAQEAAVAVWKAVPRYDATRSSLQTFVGVVVANRVASLLRARRKTPAMEPLGDHLVDGSPSIEFHVDFQRVARSLGPRDRRLAALLSDHTPTEASRVLRRSRSSVYESIGRIRTAFAAAGYSPRGRRQR